MNTEEGRSSSAPAEREGEGRCFSLERRFQSLFRPAEWCLGFRAGRRERRQWFFEGASPSDICYAFDSILSNLTPDELKRLSARPIDMKSVVASRNTYQRHSCEVCSFSIELITAVGWLDVLDVTVQCSENSNARGVGNCDVTLQLASTGFLPLSIPGASACNIFLFWVPFMSVEQSQRLDFFKDKLNAFHEIKGEKKICRA